jgi:O-antigen ligase
MDSRELIPAVGVFALVSALGFDEGGFAATAWGWSSVALLAALAVVIGRGAPRPTRAALVFVGGLAALVAWTAASLVWTSHVTATVLEVERTTLYLAAAGLFVLAGSATALLAGALAAEVLLCCYGLGRWLLGDPEIPLSADPLAGERLSEPLGYANGVAILAAMGLLLAVGFAARASQPLHAAAAAATVPLFSATLYFTFGRGAWLALGIGLAAAVSLGPRRLQLAATAGALAVPAALAVLAAHVLEAGGVVAAIVVLLGVVSAGSAFLLRTRRLVVPPAVRTACAVGLVAVPVVAAAAVVIRLGGPHGVYDAFAAAPAPVHGEERVLSVSGSNRADYWRVAWGMFEDAPLVGDGAGTFARNWLAARPIPQPVEDAHTLYLETLGELGPIGLALLAIALAAPFAGRRNPVALAPYVAFLAHAAQDWVWELPAVAVAALACGAAMLVPPSERRVPRTVAVVPAALCLLAALAFAGNWALAESVAAADRTDYAAAEDRARTARTLQPWSGEPWRLLGEAQLASGAVAEARRSFQRGLDRDPADWELWLDLGLAGDGPAQRRAWIQAESLNPLSPELQELGLRDR